MKINGYFQQTESLRLALDIVILKEIHRYQTELINQLLHIQLTLKVCNKINAMFSGYNDSNE